MVDVSKMVINFCHTMALRNKFVILFSEVNFFSPFSFVIFTLHLGDRYELFATVTVNVNSYYFARTLDAAFSRLKFS